MNSSNGAHRINIQIENIRKEKIRAKRRNSKEIRETKKILEDIFSKEKIEVNIIEEDVPISMYTKEIIENSISMDVFTTPSFIIVTKNTISCYLAFGCVHSAWRSAENNVRDYISNPKMNGYRSLDIQVFGPRNKRMNFKFRTEDMNSYNDNIDFSMKEKQNYYDELMEKIGLLEENLKGFPSREIGIGHNHPLEDYDLRPLSIEDIDLIRESVYKIKKNANSPKEKEMLLRDNAEELEKHGNKILNYISNKLELFATEAAKEAGKETGKWVVRIGAMSILSNLLIEVGRAVLKWLYASNIF